MGAKADPLVGSDSFVYADFIALLSDDELDCVRRFVVADAYARFRRDRGGTVLFAVAIQTLGREIELEATRRDLGPPELVDELVDRLRRRYEALAISCDWSRTVVASRPETCRRTQRIFLELFDAGLIHRRLPADGEGSWSLRSGAYAESCDRDLDALPGWAAEAIEAQRQALGRVDGVEIEAMLLGGASLLAFTPYADAISDAAFVAISPNHREVDSVATPSELDQLRNNRSTTPMAQTGAQAAVPGVEALLPVVVTPTVDDRFGPTVSLGIPGRDKVDSEIAERLETRAGLPFRATTASSKPASAQRFRLADRSVSCANAWGIPIPIVHCDSCGPVAADPEDVPALASASAGSGGDGGAETCLCSRCGGSGVRDPETIAAQFAAMWTWSTICIPPGDREASSLPHSELDRWLPTSRAIWSSNDSERFLDQRIAAKAAGELDALPGLNPPEPSSAASLCGAVRTNGQGGIGGIEELDELVSQVGADVARLTILHAASPQRPSSWSPASVRHAQRFLKNLRDYAEPRLASREPPLPREIDRSTRLRRRLSAWCDVADVKISASFERLAMHRATHDLMLFLKRICDFEQRCIDAGGLSPQDRDALVVALLRLVRLAAACVPDTASELEAIAGTEAAS
jgi:leucyl-tRNA synthetase